MQGFPRADGERLDLEVHPGEIVRVVGPNGSGKTSLLRALAGLDSWLQPASVESAPCGFAMQHAMDSLIGLTVDGEFDLRDRSTPKGLGQLAERDVATLSAGEARRVATTVATGTGSLVLLDEPSEGLDATARRRLAKTLDDLRRDGGSVVVADHGDHWTDLADRTVALGQATENGLPPFGKDRSTTVLSVPPDALRFNGRTFSTPALRLGPGFHALTGPNGCGKTQTLRHLFSTTRDVRMLPTHAQDLLTGDTVAACLGRADAATVAALVPPTVMDRHPWTLSGGEQQRVALAKVLGTPARIVLLDEPEAHLDDEATASLHRLIQARIDDGACFLAATHDDGWIQAASSVVTMEAA